MKYDLLHLDDFMISVIRPERLSSGAVTPLQLKSYLLMLNDEVDLIKEQFAIAGDISGNFYFKRYMRWHQTELFQHLEITLYYILITSETESEHQHILVSFYNRVCYKIEELLRYCSRMLKEHIKTTATGTPGVLSVIV